MIKRKLYGLEVFWEHVGGLIHEDILDKNGKPVLNKETGLPN